MTISKLIRLAVGLFIDFGIFYIFSQLFLFFYFTFMQADLIPNAYMMLVSLFATLVCLYGVLPLKTNGRTIGRFITRTRVVFTKKTAFPFFKYFIREFVLKIPLIVFTIGFLIIYNIYLTITRGKFVYANPIDYFLKMEVTFY